MFVSARECNCAMFFCQSKEATRILLAISTCQRYAASTDELLLIIELIALITVLVDSNVNSDLLYCIQIGCHLIVCLIVVFSCVRWRFDDILCKMCLVIAEKKEKSGAIG